MNASLCATIRRDYFTKYEDEFHDGWRCGARGVPTDTPREDGGYPKGFNQWNLERKNAWFCGWQVGIKEKAE